MTFNFRESSEDYSIMILLFKIRILSCKKRDQFHITLLRLWKFSRLNNSLTKSTIDNEDYCLGLNKKQIHPGWISGVEWIINDSQVPMKSRSDASTHTLASDLTYLFTRLKITFNLSKNTLIHIDKLLNAHKHNMVLEVWGWHSWQFNKKMKECLKFTFTNLNIFRFETVFIITV